MCVILHLVRRYRPARFLEVGTHLGYTTRILAEKFPEMAIVTVDPGDQVPEDDRPDNQRGEYLPQERIGELVRDKPNVTVVKRFFHEIDWSRHDAFEMIFVDGNHTLKDVLRDSRLALRLVTDPGVVIWHDFNNVADVNLALEQLHLSTPICSIHNTWVAYRDTH
jgi:predicted O-methyltransferase YrrM